MNCSLGCTPMSFDDWRSYEEEKGQLNCEEVCLNYNECNLDNHCRGFVPVWKEEECQE